MAYLSLNLLGPFQAILEEQPIASFESNKARALLAYLAVEIDRPQPREKLAGLLWPEWPDSAARSNLRYTLSNLRKAIGDHQATVPLLCISRQAIQFNEASDTWVDATVFSQLVDQPSPSPEDLESAIALYQGEFLEGFSLGDSTNFEEWLLLKRDQFQRQMLSALYRAANIYTEQGNYEHALTFVYQQVALEPWQEEAHRQLMYLLALNHQRGAALAQYEVCRRTLLQELNVEPALETRQLYEQIRDGAFNSMQLNENPMLSQPIKSINLTSQGGLSSVRQPKDVPSRDLGFTRLNLARGGILLLFVVAMIGVFLLARKMLLDKNILGNTMSPGESRVALICEDISPPQICLVYPQTGSFTQLTSDLTFERIIPPIVWSPDGKRLIFVAKPMGLADSIYIMDANGPKEITQSLGPGGLPIWSPDGKRIAFVRDENLWVMDVNGKQAHQITFQSCITSIAWSPDSRYIAFSDNLCKSGQKPLSIQVIDVDGEEIQTVHAFDRHGAAALAWNPDGKQVACFCIFEGEEGGWLFNADGGGEPQRISQIPISWNANYWPQWVDEK